MGFFDMFSYRPSPKDVAKDRLKIMLIHDRGELDPEIIEKIKIEIVQAISKYLVIEPNDVEINVTKTEDIEGEPQTLVANIPIKNLKGR